ncbi:hypothetical protein D8Y22_01340 [Salinadaptatus halalkaliphilus]|uniref:Small CPxCG-related zinc finger protein n=1 Tax=Salinadaptatus halalkaliphilus TaxID=2419781 RepID=A0A4V3VLT4_9EURY|nr:hypothetical protein [Salinadaptatus halalkaliphilus]THE66867.1 hypothetical protein D8Y22_01340 [Salinadaptatus halalkaliphilus]
MATREPTADLEGEAVNWRQTNGGVTLYDETNPDAWIEMAFEAGVDPEHRLFMICPDCGAVFAQRSKPGSGTVCGDCGAAFDHEE